jgi:LuxR family maltose regulon positive regulatory protein
MRKDVTIERSLCKHKVALGLVVVIDESYELTQENVALMLAILEAQPGSPPCESRAEVSAVDELSHTERRVLRYLPSNLSRSHIARELYVSVNTVSTHIRNIYSKLDARTRAEAVDRARQLRLIAH